MHEKAILFISLTDVGALVGVLVGVDVGIYVQERVQCQITI